MYDVITFVAMEYINMGSHLFNSKGNILLSNKQHLCLSQGLLACAFVASLGFLLH